MQPSHGSIAFLAAIAAVVVFYPSTEFGFVWDDRAAIVGNQALNAKAPLLALLETDFWGS